MVDTVHGARSLEMSVQRVCAPHSPRRRISPHSPSALPLFSTREGVVGVTEEGKRVRADCLNRRGRNSPVACGVGAERKNLRRASDHLGERPGQRRGAAAWTRRARMSFQLTPTRSANPAPDATHDGLHDRSVQVSSAEGTLRGQAAGVHRRLEGFGLAKEEPRRAAVGKLWVGGAPLGRKLHCSSQQRRRSVEDSWFRHGSISLVGLAPACVGPRNLYVFYVGSVCADHSHHGPASAPAGATWH